MVKHDGTRGLNKDERNAIEALCIFLEDHKACRDDIDIEPWADKGYQIKIKDKHGGLRYQAWGKDIRDAINNLVKSIVYR